MSEQKAARVTIYLPRHLLDFADRLAKEMCTSRSDVIAGLLRSEEEARIQSLMAQAYRETSERNRDEAEEALRLTREVVFRDR